MISRETRRLRRLFERILVLSAAGGAGMGAYACSNASSGSTGSGDASTPDDATSESSSGHSDGPSEASDGGSSRDVGSESASSTDGGAEGGSCDPNVEPDALWSQCCEPPPAFAWDAGADVSPTCAYHVTLPCGLPSFVQNVFPPNCALYLSDCTKLCTGAAYPFIKCEIANGYGCDDDAMAFVAADGQAIAIECDRCNGVGRRPAGLVRTRAREASSGLGAYFAAAAHLEAASVHAFERLAEELELYEAPPRLARAARRSARQEARHARATSRLARRFGGDPPAVRVTSKRARTLAVVALENAVEGCVRETFGALVASHQAMSAGDPEIRRTMGRIAADEIRHAALAWAIARAVEPRLDDRARRKIARARARAIAELRRDAVGGVSGNVACAAGLPGAERARRMIDELSAALWS